MLRYFFFFSLLSIAFFTSCKEKKDSIYSDCCGSEATSDTIHMVFTVPDQQGGTFDTTLIGRIFIPNIFTPADNRLPESPFFLLFANENIIQVLSSKCYSEGGELIFSKENFQPNDPAYGWWGDLSDGTIYSGPFEYEISVKFLNGQIRTYSGKACAYKCGDIGFPSDRLPDCLFPMQNNGSGTPDPDIPQPSYCF